MFSSDVNLIILCQSNTENDENSVLNYLWCVNIAKKSHLGVTPPKKGFSLKSVWVTSTFRAQKAI